MPVRNTTGAGQLAVGNPYRPGGVVAVGDSKPAELVVVVQQIQVLDQVHFHRLYERGNQGKQQQKLGEFVERTMRKNWVNLWSELCASVRKERGGAAGSGT
jgi:hypothetical protein